MVKKVVSFKLDPLTIEQLNKMVKGGLTKVSVVENAIDILYLKWKEQEREVIPKKQGKYFKEVE